MSTKYLAENESIQGLMLKDKAFICTKTNGLDYKASYEALLNQIEKDIAYKQFLRDVGEELKFVLHNKHRDAPKFSDDMFEWVLGNGQEAYSEQYPDYCKKFNITTEKFNFPDLRDGYIVSNPIGSGKPNGLYILDSIKAHNHSTPAHSHTINDIRGYFGVGGADNDDSASGLALGWVGGAFSKVVDRLRNCFAKTSYKVESGYYEFSSHKAGVKATNNGGASNTGNFGTDQTAGRRTTAQIYIKARFLI